MGSQLPGSPSCQPSSQVHQATGAQQHAGGSQGVGLQQLGRGRGGEGLAQPGVCPPSSHCSGRGQGNVVGAQGVRCCIGQDCVQGLGEGEGGCNAAGLQAVHHQGCEQRGVGGVTASAVPAPPARPGLEGNAGSPAHAGGGRSGSGGVI